MTIFVEHDGSLVLNKDALGKRAVQGVERVLSSNRQHMKRMNERTRAGQGRVARIRDAR